MSINDIIDSQDELSSYSKVFTLWPQRWDTIADIDDFEWYRVEFNENNIEQIPKESGIYSFIINPFKVAHPHGYLGYLGKADSMTLRARYRSYLSERNNESGRPKIVRLLNKWDGHLEFCYLLTDDYDLSILEERLINAFIPPFNSDYSSEINRAQGALR